VRRLAARSGGVLSEHQRAALAAETCVHRARQCAALLTAWQHAVPRSPERDRLWAAGTIPSVIAGTASDEVVDHLVRLHGGAAHAAAVADPLANDPLAEAMAATNRFARYYHHAAPFERSALAAYWDRCERPSQGAVRCREKRAVAEAVLGVLPPGLEVTASR
jgi:hypothetical protein